MYPQSVNTENLSYLKIKWPLWLTKLTHYEYWPFGIFYIPAFFYWCILAIKSRHLLYFTTANPSIEMGGFFGESKSKILDQIPPEFIAPFIFIDGNTYDYGEILKRIQDSGISFPLVCKPDKGERGYMVRIIETEQKLKKYFQESTGDVIVQKYISHDIELGILYYRFPNGGESGISSITTKSFFSVVGDGNSSIEELIKGDTRYLNQLNRMRDQLGSSIYDIPPSGSKILLEPIGNHCKGTMFLNGNHLINPELVKVFDKVTASMNGFYFGRFDLRVKSVEDLYKGENFFIMELNGTTSEPSHIYDPAYNIFKAYRDIFYNMKIVKEISVQNIKIGIKPTTVGLFIKTITSHFRNID